MPFNRFQLIKLRKHRKLSQSALAKLLSTHQANIGRYESGADEPRFDMVAKMARCFGVPVDVFRTDHHP